MNELPPEHPGNAPTPFEAMTASDRLPSRFVDPARPLEILGYDISEDLHEHYSFAELLYLGLTGVLPDRRVGEVMRLVLLALSPVHAGEADANVAILGGVVRSDFASTLGATAVTAAENARSTVEDHERWLRFLAGHETRPPEFDAAADELADVERFTGRLSQAGIEVPGGASWRATAYAALFEIGLCDPRQLLVVTFQARMPLALAEGLNANLAPHEYPNNVPRYRYVDTRR